MASKKENDDSQKVGKDAGKSYALESACFTPKTEKYSEILLSRYGNLTLQTTGASTLRVIFLTQAL
jgi:hypothetical protein